MHDNLTSVISDTTLFEFSVHAHTLAQRERGDGGRFTCLVLRRKVQAGHLIEAGEL